MYGPVIVCNLLCICVVFTIPNDTYVELVDFDNLHAIYEKMLEKSILEGNLNIHTYTNKLFHCL